MGSIEQKTKLQIDGAQVELTYHTSQNSTGRLKPPALCELLVGDERPEFRQQCKCTLKLNTKKQLPEAIRAAL